MASPCGGKVLLISVKASLVAYLLREDACKLTLYGCLLGENRTSRYILKVYRDALVKVDQDSTCIRLAAGVPSP